MSCESLWAVGGDLSAVASIFEELQIYYCNKKVLCNFASIHQHRLSAPLPDRLSLFLFLSRLSVIFCWWWSWCPELNQSAGSLLPCMVFMWLGSFIQLLLKPLKPTLPLIHLKVPFSDTSPLFWSPSLSHAFCLGCLSMHVIKNLKTPLVISISYMFW